MAGQKFITNNAGALTEVAATQTTGGAVDAGKIPALDAAGRLAVGMMPVGIGADTATLMGSEALSAGDYVNIWSNGGMNFAARKADATVAGKEAHGFVLAATGVGAGVVVYFEATNTAVTAQNPGVVYLQTTAGLGGSAVPSGAGNIAQRIGFATSLTSVNFQSNPPIVLA
jgi:hypothetical protein